MNQRKSTNSILVLATLGVYLGLVLAGATPQVLAQAAMAREFNIKDEVEVKDDLDKSPGSDEIKAFLENRFETALSRFIGDLRELKALGKYKKDNGGTFSISAVTRHCSIAGRSGDSSFGPASDGSDWIANAYTSLQTNFQISDDLPSFIQFAPAENNDRCKTFGTDTELDSSDLIVRISFSRDGSQNAALLSDRLNCLFKKRAGSLKDPLTRQLYEYTKAASVNDQVSITTRLPRAGLDSLLTIDAK